MVCLSSGIKKYAYYPIWRQNRKLKHVIDGKNVNYIAWLWNRNVMLVHGEGEKMKFLKNKIKQEHGIECFMPANGETAVIPVPVNIPARISGQGVKHRVIQFERQGLQGCGVAQ